VTRRQCSQNFYCYVYAESTACEMRCTRRLTVPEWHFSPMRAVRRGFQHLLAQFHFPLPCAVAFVEECVLPSSVGTLCDILNVGGLCIEYRRCKTDNIPNVFLHGICTLLQMLFEFHFIALERAP
jgi:hypothetical protein